MPVCTDCGGTVIEYDAAAGNGFCVQCGTVIEENTIVNEVSFGETSTGAAMVQGAFVGQGATHARMGGPFGNRGNSESREQTIANANRRISQIASNLHLSETVSMSASRLYSLAVEHKFTKGRKAMNVVAVCLYVACRQKGTRSLMLIDFSDLLQVNVFELGHTYLQLVQTLNLRLPLVDPSHYISRFAALLEFGDETSRVATDAVRLVQRFDRDWMTKGRRPAGICGACLLLAARMNNFRRSIEEIVQVVKIADTTLKKRLDEFKRTRSANLTIGDFRTVWLEEEMDPPAFYKDKEGEEGGDEEEYEDGETGKKRKKKGKGKKGKRGRKRKKVDSEDEEMEDAEMLEKQPGTDPSQEQVELRLQPSQDVNIPIDPALFNTGILEGISPHADPLFLSETQSSRPQVLDDSNIDPALLDQSAAMSSPPPPVHNPPPLAPGQQSEIDTEKTDDVTFSIPSEETDKEQDFAGAPPPPEDTALEAALDETLVNEVSNFLMNKQGTEMNDALTEMTERQTAGFTVVDELLGLDEDELDKFLLTDEEVKIKERVWVEMNKEYLEAIALKAEQRDNGSTSKPRKKRKTNSKPRDASTPHGNTAAESVRSLLKQPKYSKRINYNALKDLFGGPNATSGAGDEKDDDHQLYTMDDDKDDEVVDEAGGGVGTGTGQYGEGGSDKEDDYGWEEGFEQEV